MNPKILSAKRQPFCPGGDELKKAGPVMRLLQLLGWGLLSQFPPFCYFPKFSALSKHMLAIEHHIYIWQVSPQPSCGNSCQIWMWCKEFNRYFSKIENFAYGKIDEWSFSNPQPWSHVYGGLWLAAFLQLTWCLVVLDPWRHNHYSHLTWASWHLKSPATWLFVQKFIQVDLKENTRDLHDWSFVTWFPLTKGQ